MSNAITILGSTYTVAGTVKNKYKNEGILDLHVFVYDKDILGKDDFLGIGVTDATGAFSVSFDSAKYSLHTTLDKFFMQLFPFVPPPITLLLLQVIYPFY